MRLSFSAILLLQITSAHALEAKCGDPPRIEDQSLKVEVEGKAKLLFRSIADTSLSGKMEAARTDIFSKFPDANKARSDTYFQYMFCQFVINDPQLSELKKIDALKKFQKIMQSSENNNENSPPPSPSMSTNGDQGPIVQGTKGDVNINFETPSK